MLPAASAAPGGSSPPTSTPSAPTGPTSPTTSPPAGSAADPAAGQGFTNPTVAALTPAATAGGTGTSSLALVLFDTDIVLVGGRSFAPSQDVAIEATTDDLGGSATVRAGADGRFLLGFQVPQGFAGTVTVTAGEGAAKTTGSLTVGTPSPAPTAAPAPPASGPAPASSVDSAGKLSGLPWMSGVHPSNELAPYLAFGDWRGRPIDISLVFTIRDSGWGPITQPDWPVNDFASFKGRLVISQPMYPKGQGNNADCAKGAYDAQWKQFGSYLVSKNRADSIVRVGWEFNGTFMYWHADSDPANFIECFRKVSTAIRSTDPQVKIDWTYNAHNSPVPGGGTPWGAYPGDQYVDYVSIDPYDHYPASRDEATFDRQCNDPNGLCYAIKFARDHGKKVGVGEWGVASCSGDGGGDNPLYIRKMWETFVANKDVMGYESYYHDSMPGNVCSTIMNGGQNPSSSAEYKKLWGAGA